jgi:hypothetical protein
MAQRFHSSSVKRFFECLFPKKNACHTFAEEALEFEETASSPLSVTLTVTSFIFRFDLEPSAFRGGTTRGIKRAWSAARSSSDVRVIGIVLVGSELRTYCMRRFEVKIFNVSAIVALKSSHLVVLDCVTTLRMSLDLLEISSWYVKSVHQ